MERALCFRQRGKMNKRIKTWEETRLECRWESRMAGQAGRRQIRESIVHYVSESNFTPPARGSHEKMLSRVGAWLVAGIRKLSGSMAFIRLERMKMRTREN